MSCRWAASGLAVAIFLELFAGGCVNPILTRRGNTLLPRQPIRRTWGQLGEQLDRVVGAAGFVHRRRSKEATASE